MKAKRRIKIRNSISSFFSAPNTRLYMWLLFISFLITACVFLLDVSSHMCTVVAGLGCGGIASTLVAWLIEHANWEADLRKKSTLQSQIFYNIGDCFKSGTSAFIYQALQYKQIEDIKTKHTWIEWVGNAYDGIKDDQVKAYKFNEAFRLLCNTLSGQIHIIEGQKAYLVDGNILDIKDCETLENLLPITEFLAMPRTAPDNDPVVFANICLQLAKGMYSELERSLNFQFINTREFESIIGKMYANKVYEI